MTTEIQSGEMDGNSHLAMDFGTTLLTGKGGWTAEELGIQFDEDEETQMVFAKEDFLEALKKVSRKVKK